MCDHHQLRSQHPVGEIDHVNDLSENIGALFENEDYSDIILLASGVEFHAHRVILASRSDYFRALLFGGLRESQPGVSTIELKDTTPDAFRHLLKYIYTGRVNLADMKEENLLDVLGLSHQYGFLELESSISDYLKATLNIRNVCFIYDLANMYGLASLCKTCYEFIDRNAPDVLRGEAFLSLSGPALYDIISRDSFCAAEIDIFNAIKVWSERNPEVDVAPIMSVVRLPLMTIPQLLNTVRPTEFVSPDSILDAIKTITETRNMQLKYRGFLLPEENVATLRHGATVLRGEMKAALLDGDTTNYDLDRGFSRHPIDENNGQGILIKLNTPSIINCIKVLLWDRDMRSYSYYLEVSMDEKDWIRVVDHRKYLCRSWQYCRFPDIVAKYVRVVGTHNTVNRVFHCVALECYYTHKICSLKHGLIVPTENVATVAASATVIEGVSRSRNALINGDTKNYDWDSGYTCHQLGSGAIIVQLAQPYLLSNMRLLLWDCDERSYSYNIEVSTDQVTWHTVCNRSNKACKGWQVINFEERPVTFVKIVGTHNTANEVFHCVHFECPADEEALNRYLLETRERKNSNVSDCSSTNSLPQGVGLQQFAGEHVPYAGGGVDPHGAGEALQGEGHMENNNPVAMAEDLV
ncbi:unnamed protein product [Owenia fusiformis]|uniref:Uncharacterized protein n=1 Tax=Owenia fusiformis TaxID=6347 RepID=A0A8J1U5F6_OWEFU|nr:unnamed protein product [Owenia fusiformis]